MDNLLGESDKEVILKIPFSSNSQGIEEFQFGQLQAVGNLVKGVHVGCFRNETN